MKWIEPEPLSVPNDFMQAIGGPPIVAQTIFRRGLTQIEQALAFLDPDYYSPTSPWEMPGIRSAVDLLTAALQQNLSICVWGDFDVDGQTSTTALVQGLRHFGGRVRHYIPVRGRESHGLHTQSLSPILDEGVDLLITCDTGVSDFDAVAFAQDRGVQVIITDHHDLPEELPQAEALLNPKLLPNHHTFHNLPGVGVVYVLIEALAAELGQPEYTNQLLDLAALGIVADVANLSGEPRYLLQRGLPALRDTPRLGLRTMMELAELAPASLTEEHIGFSLGPRLNALGRLGDANLVVDFLTTQDPLQARLVANELEGLNARRQLLTDQVFRSALDLIQRQPATLEFDVLVLAHPTWPGGVVGIVANRLAERFQRPVILLTAPPGQPARGSARSVPNIDITLAISQQQKMLLSYGGHPMAAGLSLDQRDIEAFRRGVSRAVAQQAAAAPEPTLSIDAHIPLEQIDFNLVNAIERMAPFGQGNPPPILLASGVTIDHQRVIGRNDDHLMLDVADTQGVIHRVLWWNGAGMPRPEGGFDLAYTARATSFRGQPQIQIEWQDWRMDRKPSGVEITQPMAMEVLDHRHETDPENLLSAIEEIEQNLIVWREGAWIDRIKGTDRFSLQRAEALVIWTIPGSLEILHQVIDAVKPSRLFLFALDPEFGTPAEFINGLGGLVKFALHEREGRTSLQNLASRLAQPTPTVETGLNWLQARGDITIEDRHGDEWQLGGDGHPQDGAKDLAQAIEAMLAETQAFQDHYRRVEHGYLLIK